MDHVIGMTLHATNLTLAAAELETGRILFEDTYDSPFRRTGNELHSGEPEVFLDTVLQDTPIGERASKYVRQTIDKFMADHHVNSFFGIGASFAGKTWQSKGTCYVIGGNTPIRFAVDTPDGKGIAIDPQIRDRDSFKAKNDAEASFDAQALTYQYVQRVDPLKTAYIVLGTGFGGGCAYPILLEIGHLPMGFIPEALMQPCGCSKAPKTSCGENYGSGRGLAETAKLLMDGYRLSEMDAIEEIQRTIGKPEGSSHLSLAVYNSSLKGNNNIDSKAVMEAANAGDPFAKWVVDLGARAVADSIAYAAQITGADRFGLGDSVALNNPGYVRMIAQKVTESMGQSNFHPAGIIVEQTPIHHAGMYGALVQAIPSGVHEAWARTMKADR